MHLWYVSRIGLISALHTSLPERIWFLAENISVSETRCKIVQVGAHDRPAGLYTCVLSVGCV